MNETNKMMGFTSKKYNDDQLKEMGLIAKVAITCRRIDVDNHHFINYHLHDIFIRSNGQVKDQDAYIIEAGDHKKDGLSNMEILYFATRMHRDKFVFINHENFKLTDHDGKITHEQLALTYLN